MITTKISPEEYLERERKAVCKSEYWHGEVFAMSGAVANHLRICTNVILAAGPRLRQLGCDVWGSDMKVGLSKRHGFFYPDVLVVCGKPKFLDAVQDVLINPIVILEVLSDSTRGFDLGPKFREYKKLESLKHYITIEQNTRLVSHYNPQADGSWRVHDLKEEGDVLRLRSVGIELPLSEIYLGIEVETEIED